MMPTSPESPFMRESPGKERTSEEGKTPRDKLLRACTSSRLISLSSNFLTSNFKVMRILRGFVHEMSEEIRVFNVQADSIHRLMITYN